MKRFLAPLILVLMIAVVPVSFAAAKRYKLTVTSPAFKHNQPIPAKYAISPDVPGGENCSIPLKWKVPKAAKGKIKSFALSMVDPHKVAKNFVHWLVVDIPSNKTELKECVSQSTMPHEAFELQNGYEFLGYGGPGAPPGTGVHPYHITIYGLNVRSLNLTKREMTLKKFRKLLKGKTVAQGKIIGTFKQD